MSEQPIAPAPRFPERPGTVYERKMAESYPGMAGPLRFEEGIGTDTDIPNEFAFGAQQGYQTPPGRPNHNMNVFEKPAQQTMAERAHVGSAAWIEAPTMLRDFVQGSFTDYAEVTFEEVVRPGTRLQRANPTVVTD